VLFALPSTGFREIGLYDSARFLVFRALDDSWDPISRAWLYLQNPGDDSVYQAIFFGQSEKFQYALTSLLPVELIQLFHSGDEVPFGPMNAVSWLAMWVTALFVILILLRAMDDYAPEYAPRSTLERLVLAAVVGCMTLTFYPIAKAFSLGQIQTWINCLFAILVWLWMTNRPIPAGIVGGVICAIKPQLGLLLLWGLLRRRWGFSGAFAGTLGAIGLVTLVLYGIENNFDYLNVLSYISRRGEAYYPNQTVNGLLNRLLDNGDNVDFRATDFPPFHPVVYVGTLVSSIAIVGAALFWRPGEHARAGVLDLLVAALSFTIASPVAWEHHYGILMPMFAVLLPALIRWSVLGKWTLPVLAVAYVLSATYFDVAQEVAATPLLTPLQSYLFAGALIVLGLLYAVRHAAAADVTQAPGQQPANSTAPGAPSPTIS
jgi:hypothetical protein